MSMCREFRAFLFFLFWVTLSRCGTTLSVCLVGERRDRSAADPRFGDGSDPSQVWLEMLGWSDSHPFFLFGWRIEIGNGWQFSLRQWVPHVIRFRVRWVPRVIPSSSSSSSPRPWMQPRAPPPAGPPPAGALLLPTPPPACGP
jgi:hypothetical protein